MRVVLHGVACTEYSVSRRPSLAANSQELIACALLSNRRDPSLAGVGRERQPSCNGSHSGLVIVVALKLGGCGQQSSLTIYCLGTILDNNDNLVTQVPSKFKPILMAAIQSKYANVLDGLHWKNVTVWK